MKCPACVELGYLSKLYMDSGSFTTLMGWSSYYDEDGIYHSHDPNRHSTGGRCSQDHQIYWSSYSKCPAGDYERDEVVRVSYRCEVCKSFGKESPDAETCSYCESKARDAERKAKADTENATQAEYRALPGWERRRTGGFTKWLEKRNSD